MFTVMDKCMQNERHLNNQYVVIVRNIGIPDVIDLHEVTPE